MVTNLNTFKYNFVVTLFFCGLGCLACYGIQLYFQVPNYLSSILVGLIGSFLQESKYYDYKKAIACIYAGSFSSMCSLSYFSNKIDILVLSLLVGLFFNLCSPYFRGTGGKLGTIAFLSSVTFIFFKGLL